MLWNLAMSIMASSMITNRASRQRGPFANGCRITLCFVAALLLRVHFSSFGPRPTLNPPISFVANMESISSLGQALYLRYADLLILNSLVLTVALFGALVLAHMRSA